MVLGVALLVARPLSVLVSALGTSISLREGILLAFVAPRGIVAAAVSALFALRLEALDVPDADLLVPLTFMVIIGTVVIQSLCAGALAAKLGLSSRGEQGVLVVGANNVALAIAKALQDCGLRVKVADTRRDGLQQARMLGMETYFGNPLSDHAERFMDLSGFTHLVAMSRSPELNAVVCDQYRHDFGPKNVFSVQSGHEEEDERHGLSKRLQANLLFPRDTTWAKLASLMAKGAQVHSTRLTDDFDFEAYKAQWGNVAIPLFALNGSGRLRMRLVDSQWSPEAGWTLVSLVPGDDAGNKGNGKNGKNGNGDDREDDSET
jgi:hypothetical protein